VTTKKADGTVDTILVPQDTVVVSGNGVVSLGLSYRFPLYAGHSIDRKLGFIFLDKLYAAVNVGSGIAYDKLSDFIDRTKAVDLSKGRSGILADMLVYAGAELRLEALSFSTLPLALKARWDWGFDKAAPIGGHKFSLMVGFSFDNWELVLEPDGAWDSSHRVTSRSRSPAP